MCYKNSKKAVVGSSAKGRQQLLNLPNRNEFLANQVFSNFDYAKNFNNPQRLCKCGNPIPKDWMIFNNSTRCQNCEAERINQRRTGRLAAIISPGQKHGGRTFRQQDCKFCLKNFWRLGMGANVCRECSGSFSIPETVDAYIKPLGGTYVL